MYACMHVCMYVCMYMSSARGTPVSIEDLSEDLNRTLPKACPATLCCIFLMKYAVLDFETQSVANVHSPNCVWPVL